MLSGCVRNRLNSTVQRTQTNGIRYTHCLFGLVGNVVGRINEVSQRLTRLVLEWVTL